MKWRAGILVVAIALALVLAPGTAVADTYKSSGRAASAYAEVWAEDAEMPELFVGVSAGAQSYMGQVPGYRVDKGTMDAADVWIDWPVDLVDGAFVRFAYLSVAPYDPGIDRTLTTASVHADLEGMLVEGTLAAIPAEPGAFELVIANETPISGRVDLDWVGSGDLVPYKFRMQDWGSGYRVFDRFAGKYRPAMVTGTLSVDGVDHLEDLEFTGDLSQSRGMTIIHGDFPELGLSQ